MSGLYERLNNPKLENAAFPAVVAAKPITDAIFGALLAFYTLKAAKETSEKTKESSSDKIKQEIAGKYGSPNFDPDPDDEKHGSKTALDIEKEIQKLKELRLKDHEGDKHNGHTIERHVGKSIEYLKERMVIEGKKKVTSYKDYQTAEEVTKEIIKKNEMEIAKWYKEKPLEKIKDFDAIFNEEIGYGIKKGEEFITPRNKAKVVVVRTESGIKLLTSYPID